MTSLMIPRKGHDGFHLQRIHFWLTLHFTVHFSLAATSFEVRMTCSTSSATDERKFVRKLSISYPSTLMTKISQVGTLNKTEESKRKILILKFLTNDGWIVIFNNIVYDDITFKRVLKKSYKYVYYILWKEKTITHFIFYFIYFYILCARTHTHIHRRTVLP